MKPLESPPNCIISRLRDLSLVGVVAREVGALLKFLLFLLFAAVSVALAAMKSLLMFGLD